ncbi:hypothetical protein KM043_011763 [Ampulex compressa]|nr:hypothetical protein KM043_011763 [Ampulex compressa]
MWLLKSLSGEQIYLKVQKELTFGRRKSDIVLQNDESISRVHASIVVQLKDVVEENEPTSICKVKDMGSKYGTYILGKDKLIEVSKDGYDLKPNEKIRFGLQNHIYIVVYIPVIIVLSAINDQDRQNLQDIMDKIDGMISAEWTNCCTHLTVSKAMLTEKVTWALASAIPIVSIDFWVKMENAFENGNEFPDANDYIPKISDAMVHKQYVSLGRNEKRKSLFKNLIFVHFTTRQYKMLGKMINMAGGKSVFYGKTPISPKDLCAPNIAVLQYSGSDATQSTQCDVSDYREICNALQASKRRPIAESEIPLAILFCTTENYCNPMFQFGSVLKSSEVKRNMSKVILVDTQDLNSQDIRELPRIISDVPIKSNVNVKRPTNGKAIYIPETYDSFDISKNPENDKNDTQGCKLITPFAKKKDVHYIPETYDSLNESNSSRADESNLMKEPVCPQENVNIIPETIDSYTRENSQIVHHTVHRGEESAQKNSFENRVKEIPNVELVEVVKSPKKSYTSEAVKKCDKPASQVKLNAPAKFKNVIEITEERAHSPDDCVIIPDSDTDTISSDKRPSNVSKELNKKPEKRSPNSVARVNSEFTAPKVKKVCLNTQDDTDPLESVCDRTMDSTKSNTTFSKMTASFLRDMPGHKIFKKVYKRVPSRRIKLENMYVWNAAVCQQGEVSGH